MDERAKRVMRPIRTTSGVCRGLNNLGGTESCNFPTDSCKISDRGRYGCSKFQCYP